MRSSAVGALRDATRESHGALERVAVATGFMSSARAYRAYLCAMWGFHAPLEPVLERALAGTLADVDARRKLGWLAGDLDRLGVRSEERERLSRAEPPRMRDRLEALGVAYVIEGSTLGGRYILRELTRGQAVDPAVATFFAGYGARTGEMWRRFVESLDAVVSGPTAITSATGAAVATFDAMRAWLEETLAPGKDDLPAPPP